MLLAKNSRSDPGEFEDGIKKSWSQPTIPTHLFVELTSLDELSFPTSSSARIRYTCMSASPHYLAVGSTSGTVYLFSRYAAKYRKSLSSVPVQVIACKEGAVQHLSASANEKYLAVATSRGHVSVVSLVGNYPSVLLNNTVHVGQAVSSLCWISDSSRLYIGDTAGRISCSRIGNRNILRSASELVLELDSSIVQLDFASYYLLISSMSRCYLYHITRYSCSSIGRKLRSGPFGACYFPSEDNEQPVIFAGRPGGRLWEVDSDGVVYSTHQFNNLISAPRIPLVSFRRPFDSNIEPPPKDSLSFEKLHILSKDFILTVNGGCLCVVDPRKARIVVLCELNEDILQYAVCNGDVFVLTSKEGALKKYSLFSLSAAVEKLHWRECFGQAAQVMGAYSPFLHNVPWKLDVIEDVILQLGNDSQEQMDERLLKNLLNVLERKKMEAATERRDNLVRLSAIRLPTGVHRVLRVMENSGYDDDFTFRAPSPFRTVLKHRSLSSPTVTELTSETATSHHHLSVLPENSKMVSSRSEDSLIQLLGSRKQREMRERHRPEKPESHCSQEVTKSVVPAPGRVGVKPLIGTPKSLEEKMLRSLELGGTKVLDSVEKMADALVNFSTLPSTSSHKGGTGTKLKTDIPYPQHGLPAEHYSVSNYWSKPQEPPTLPTPLKPMPEVPSVTQVLRTSKTKPGVVRRRKHVRNRQADSPVTSRGESPTSNTVVEDKGNALRDEELNNYRSKEIRDPRDKGGGHISNGNIVTLKMGSDYSQFGTSDYSRPVEHFTGSYFTPHEDTMDQMELQKVELESDQRFCQKCGLHKTWLTVLRIGCYISSIPVTSEEFLEGGVPSTLKEWVHLLKLRCFSGEKSRRGSTPGFICKDKALCHSCLSAFDLLRSRTMTKGTEETVTDHPSKMKLKAVASQSAAVSNDNLKSLLVGKQLCPGESLDLQHLVAAPGMNSSRQKGVEDLIYSTYHNPAYESDESSVFSAEEEVSWVEEWQRKWPWLGKAPLSGLLTAMAYVLGVKSVLETMRKHRWLRKAGTDDLWLCLGRLCGTWTELALPHDVLQSVLCDILGETDSCRVLSSFKEREALPESFVLDATQNCPCCTLPLVAKVSELSKEIIGFSCGHAFHRICLKTRTMKSTDLEEFECMKCSLLAATIATV